jgi:hypothetical protein
LEKTVIEIEYEKKKYLEELTRIKEDEEEDRRR